MLRFRVRVRITSRGQVFVRGGSFRRGWAQVSGGRCPTGQNILYRFSRRPDYQWFIHGALNNSRAADVVGRPDGRGCGVDVEPVARSSRQLDARRTARHGTASTGADRPVDRPTERRVQRPGRAARFAFTYRR